MESKRYEASGHVSVPSYIILFLSIEISERERENITNRIEVKWNMIQPNEKKVTSQFI